MEQLVQIAGIDYSQPEFKTMFANYGLTAIAAVSLEKSILLLLAAIDHLGKGASPKKVLEDYLKKTRKKQLGHLITDLKHKLLLPNYLSSRLDEARMHRNEVVHHFFVDRYETMILPDGPTMLSEELRLIRDLFISVHEEIDKLLTMVSSQMNKPVDSISEDVKRLLIESTAVYMTLNTDAQIASAG